MKNNRFEVAVRNMDDLAVLTDDELINVETDLKIMFEKACKKGFDTKKIEVELAYVHREWQIRADRKAAHTAWLEKTKQEMFDEEKNLPAFVHAAPGYEVERVLNWN